jgi:hypothetical protein
MIGRSRMTDRCTIQKRGLLFGNWGATPTITASSSVVAQGASEAKDEPRTKDFSTRKDASCDARVMSKIFFNIGTSIESLDTFMQAIK